MKDQPDEIKVPWSILMGLLHKYGITNPEHVNDFFGITKGKLLLRGNLAYFDKYEIIEMTGIIIGHFLVEEE